MSSKTTTVEGHWKIIDYPKHPECVGCQFSISHDDEEPNLYRLNTYVVNSMFCSLEHNSTTNKWVVGSVAGTEMLGPPEEMKKEGAIVELISHIENLEVQDGQHLVITINNGEQIRLKHSS